MPAHILEFPGLLVHRVISEPPGTTAFSFPNSPSQKGTLGNNAEGPPQVLIFDPENATRIAWAFRWESSPPRFFPGFKQTRGGDTPLQGWPRSLGGEKVASLECVYGSIPQQPKHFHPGIYFFPILFFNSLMILKYSPPNLFSISSKPAVFSE